MRFLSRTPILTLDGASPIGLTRAVFQRQIAPNAASLRCSIVPGALGRVKTPLRRCAVLTRPARSQVLGNYRSDGPQTRRLGGYSAGRAEGPTRPHPPQTAAQQGEWLDQQALVLELEPSLDREFQRWKSEVGV